MHIAWQECVCGFVLLQELVAIMSVSQGCVLMAPPSHNEEAKKTLAGLLSAIKPKTKVGNNWAVTHCYICNVHAL